MQITHNVLVRAIRHAERDDLVGRNVAALVDAPEGQLAGRPSKSLTLEQMVRPIGRDTYGRDGLVADFVAPWALRQLVAHQPAGLPGTISGDAIVVELR